MKWRVRIFEYGLSKNRYPYPAAAQTDLARAHLDPAFDHSPAGVPLMWTLRSAREALRHLEGTRCFADHSLDCYAEAAAGSLRQGATPRIDESSPMARSRAVADSFPFGGIATECALAPNWPTQSSVCAAAGCSPGHSIRDLVGFYSDAAMGPRGPEATLTLLENDGWARAKLLAAWQAGRPELIGFSVDAVIGVRPVGEGRSRALEVEHIAAIHSVDMVSAASSGGRAIAIVERAASGGLPERFVVRSMQMSHQEMKTARIHKTRIHKKGATMKEEIERLLEALRRAGGAVAGGPLERLQATLEAELAKPEVDASRVLAALADWLSSPDTNLSPAAAQAQEQVQEQVHEQINALRQRISEAAWRQQAAEGRSLLDSKLAGSRLPKSLASLVASRFPYGQPVGDLPISEQAVEAEIHRVREAYAAVSPAGRVLETGRVRVLQEPCDKLQTALDRLVGLPAEDSSIPAFRGIREAYVTYTGDEEISGVASNLRIHEEFNTAGFPNALGNSLRRLLLRDYQEQDFGIGLIAQFSSVPDFRTQERIRVGYFGDLPTVDPEAADYDELTAPTDEKASYSVVTFGGLVTVTRKMIINDDLGTVPKIAGRLGRSARRTLAQRVFNLMINNGAIYDSVAWFHATHGNLGSTALSAAELDVVRTAMRNRTEKDSGKKLGIGPHVLVVPNELEGLARQENERQYVDASFTPNRVRFLFGPSSERVVVSPLLTDTNDWYVFANKEEAPTVEVGFLQGRQEPEFFLADNPTLGTVFTSDRIRYKVRHEHEAVVIDYRGAYKEVVA